MNKKLILGLIFVAIFAFGAKNAEAQYSTSYNSQSSTRATITGTVNPGGNTTTAWFEYSNSNNFNNYKETSHQFIGSQNGDHPLSATITGLVPNTTYYARIVADNGKGIIRGNVITFTTNQGATNTIVNTNVVHNPVVTNTNTVYTNTAYRNQIMYVEAPIQTREFVYVEVPAHQVYSYNQIYTQNQVPVNYSYVNTVTPNTNLAQTNTVIDYNEDYNNYNNTVSANTFFINDFLPNNFLGWLLLILIVAGIVAVLRRIII